MMKKTFILLCFTLLAICVWAQDTINNDPGRYLLPTEAMANINFIVPNHRCCIFLDMGFPFAVSGDLTIHGIALRATREGTLDNLDYPYHVRVYQQGSSRLQQTLVDSVRITQQVVRDGELHPKYLRAVDSSGYLDVTFPLLEIYFKNPVTVRDTFYIWVTPLPFPEWTYFLREGNGYLAVDGEISTIEIPDDPNSRNPEFIVVHTSGMKDSPNNPEDWDFVGLPGSVRHGIYRLICFPILGPVPELSTEERLAPTTLVVTNLDRDLLQATVRTIPTVDTVYHQQIALGRWPASPDTLPLQEASRTGSTTLENLDPYTTYAVWVRNQVGNRYSYPQDTTFWTPWSAPAIFRLGHRDTMWNHGTIWVNDTLSVVGGEIIRIDSNTVWLNDSTIWIDGDTIVIGSDAVWLGSNLVIVGGERIITSSGNQGIISPSQGFTLRPNPASKEVTIEGYEGEVQIVDLQGRVVDSFTNHSPLTTHHLPALPSGTYLVKCGTTVRKLVVQ